MNLTKLYVEEVFEETKKGYTDRFGELPSITLNYIPKQQLVDDGKSTAIAQWIIGKIGHEGYADYPSFAAVYYADSNCVSFCFEFAKQLLDPIQEEYKVRCYLKHVLAHEIAHIMEDKIISDNPTLWNYILKGISGEVRGEKLSERVAKELDGNEEWYQEVHHILYDNFIDRLKSS